MGNTKSSDNSKITNQLPPTYDEIQIKKIETVIPLSPITPEFIRSERVLYKAQQLAQYEQYHQNTQQHIIKNTNKGIETHLTGSNAIFTSNVSFSQMDKTIDKKYRSTEMDELYMQKDYDFMCKMYSGFKIKITEDLPTKKTFQISL